MKYAMLGVFLFSALIGITKVNAEQYTGQAIWPSEKIANIYIKKFREDGYIKYQQAAFIRRSEDNKFVYCLQPYVDIDNNLPYYNIERRDYATVLNMTEEQWDRISLLAYYGYGYDQNGYNHNAHKWYAVTQVLIWRVAEPKSRIVFTDTLNGTENPNLFVNEIAELEALVNNHYKRPEFNTTDLTLTLGQQVTLNDNNNVLSNFTVGSTNNVSAVINGNSLTLTGTGIGEASVNLVKKAKKYSEAPIVYYSNHSQNVFRVGYYDPIPANYNLRVVGGKIKITKVDSETNTTTAQGQATLVGAKYNVIDSSGNVVSTLTIGEDKTATTNNLPLGTYTIKEISPSTGYYLDNTEYKITVDSSETFNLTVKENVIKSHIKVNKIDSETKSCKAQGQATLVGAIYEIIDHNNNVVDTITIGEDCSATSKLLPYGKYSVKEKKSSTGYYLDTNNYTVNINDANTKSVTSIEEVIKGRIKVNKIDSETKSCKAQGQATLVGAKFNIMDHNNKVVDTITIGEDCSAISKYLPYGKYKIEETETPTGYYLNTEIFEQFISEKNDYILTVKENVIKNYISILKQYEYVNGNTTFLNAESNISFEIFYPNGEKYAEIKTDRNGYATLDIPYGVWKFHQINSNTGFEKIYDFFITVDENSELEQYYNILNNKISAYVQVVKKDIETGKVIAIPNVKFKIQNVNTKQYVSQFVGGKVFDTFTTDENGMFTTYLKLEAGNYKLIEVQSPKGYLLSDKGLEFSIGEDTEYSYTTYGAFVTVEFNNTPIKGQIEIYKNGETFKIENNTFKYENVPLKGIKFNVYADEDIKSSDGQHLYYNKGDLVAILVTDQDGYVKSDKLPLGKYYLVEVETKDGYVLDSKEYHFELTQKDNKTAIVYNTYKASNILKKGTLEFTKLDFSTNEPIPNTLMEIYTNQDELIFSGKTNKDGIIIIDKLPLGKYYIVEKEASEGYVLNTEKVYFEILENGDIVKASMTNKKITSILKITKLTEDDKLLSGVKFGVYDLEDKLIKEVISNEEGYIEIELEYGKYYFKEIATLEDYVISDEKYYFEVKNNGEIINETVINKYIKGTLEFTKLDFSTNEPIPNTLMEIYKETVDGPELIFSGLTDENGQIIIHDLLFGRYFIIEKETASPDYILNTEKMYFEIYEDGQIVKSTMVNEKVVVEVPSTDSHDYYIVEIVGSILIISGIGVIIYVLKKKKKD